MKTLAAIADQIDTLLGPATKKVVEQAAPDTLALLAHIAARHASASPKQIGEALFIGAATIEEQANEGPGSSIHMLQFLEALTSSYRQAMIERVGADADGRPDMTPVDHAVYYYTSHSMFPPGASREVVLGAMRKLNALPKK